MTAVLPFSEEWLFRQPKTQRYVMCQGQLRQTIRRRGDDKRWEYFCSHCGRTVRFD